MGDAKASESARERRREEEPFDRLFTDLRGQAMIRTGIGYVRDDALEGPDISSSNKPSTVN